MRVISHRGYWKQNNEKNLPVAFKRSFELGFGTETDLRDHLSNLVISHDMANDDSMQLARFFSLFCKYDSDLLLALNIKSDGLQLKLKEALIQFGIENYFVFDMSIPDTIGYIKNGIRFFSRQSEVELQPAFYEQCAGIWLDSFYSTWYDSSIIVEHVQNRKEVAIVSPELHGREALPFWEQLKKDGINKMEEIVLCTDLPEEATVFFK